MGNKTSYNGKLSLIFAINQIDCLSGTIPLKDILCETQHIQQTKKEMPSYGIEQ